MRNSLTIYERLKAGAENPKVTQYINELETKLNDAQETIKNQARIIKDAEIRGSVTLINAGDSLATNELHVPHNLVEQEKNRAFLHGAMWVQNLYLEFDVAIVKLQSAVEAVCRLAQATNGPETRKQLKSAMGDLLKYGGELLTTGEEINKQGTKEMLFVDLSIIKHQVRSCTLLAGAVNRFLTGKNEIENLNELDGDSNSFPLGTDEALTVLRTYVKTNKPDDLFFTGSIIPSKRGRSKGSLEPGTVYLGTKARDKVRENHGRRKWSIYGKEIYTDLEKLDRTELGARLAYETLAACREFRGGRFEGQWIWDHGKLRETVRKAVESVENAEKNYFPPRISG